MQVVIVLFYFSQNEPRPFELTFHHRAIFYYLMTLDAVDAAHRLGLIYVSFAAAMWLRLHLGGTFAANGFHSYSGCRLSLLRVFGFRGFGRVEG